MADEKYPVSNPSLSIHREIGWLPFSRHVFDETKEELPSIDLPILYKMYGQHNSKKC
jgi:hypothetical protein